MGRACPEGKVGSYYQRKEERRGQLLFWLFIIPSLPTTCRFGSGEADLPSVLWRAWDPAKPGQPEPLRLRLKLEEKGPDSSPEFVEGAGPGHFVITREKLCQTRPWSCKVEIGLVSLNLKFQNLSQSLFFFVKKYNSVVFSILTELCSHRSYLSMVFPTVAHGR